MSELYLKKQNKKNLRDIYLVSNIIVAMQVSPI